MARAGSAKVSEALRAAIAEESLDCLAGRPKLARADVAALRALLAGSPGPSPDFSRTRALKVLAAADPGPETAELLGSLLADAKASRRERLLAAALLGDIPGEASQRALLAVLPDATGVFRHELVQALAKAGGPGARAALRGLKPDPADPDLGRLAAFADLAIAVRAGEAPDPAALARAFDHRWEPVRVEALTSERIRAADAVIEGPRIGVTLGARAGFAWRCGRLETLLLFDAAFDRGSLVDVLRGRARVAGLIAEEEPGAPRRTVILAVMTVPQGEAVRILVVTPGGRLLFEGEAVPEGRDLALRLRDAKARTPVAVEGRIGADSLDLAIRAVRGVPRPKRRPMAIPLA